MKYQSSWVQSQVYEEACHCRRRSMSRASMLLSMTNLWSYPSVSDPGRKVAMDHNAVENMKCVAECVKAVVGFRASSSTGRYSSLLLHPLVSKEILDVER